MEYSWVLSTAKYSVWVQRNHHRTVFWDFQKWEFPLPQVVTRLHLQGKVARRAMCSKNTKMWTLPQMILRSCNPAIMRSCNLEQDINICNHLLSSQQNRTQNWENTFTKTIKKSQNSVFSRSHVDYLAIRSDALHHKSSASSQSSAIIQQNWTAKWENTLTKTPKKSQNSIFLEDRT